MLEKISAMIFWIIFHCIVMIVLVSFLMDNYIIETGIGTGLASYFLYQYYRKIHGMKNIYTK